MPSPHKKTVQQVNDAFTKNDREGFLKLCSDTVEWTMIGDRTVSGKDAIRDWMKSMNGDAPAFTVDDVVAEGDVVVAHGRMTMKEKTGEMVPYAYCDIYRFSGDRIAALTSFVMKTDTPAPS